ncbi:MAG: preprotein translocase subunit SecG [Planctomycetes bacterium]|nr:preprotein translocase subunit SecG [Planctomycetota bacterium]
MSFLAGLLMFIFAVVCILMIGIVLLQPSQGDGGGGLAGAFGGGGGGETVFGTKAVSAAARITVILATLYFGLALLINARFLRTERSLMPPGSGSTQKIEQPPAPPGDSGSHGDSSSSPGGSGAPGSSDK